MRVLGLNNRPYIINLSKYSSKSEKKSQYHLKARELLFNLYPSYSIYEEVKLPGTVCPSKKSALFIDFFIPNLSLGIEVHGKQHYEYTPYFHKSKLGWLQAQKRDGTKAEWCELNNINLVVLKFSDSLEEWKQQIECR